MSLNFEKHAAKANQILRELAAELGNEEDINKAGRILRCVLHALRDIITTEESMHLVSQLPFMLKALYIDGWKMFKKHPRIRHIDDFMDEVYSQSLKMGFYDFPKNSDAYDSIIAVFGVLKRHISEGEVESIRSVLPKELKLLWDEPVFSVPLP